MELFGREKKNRQSTRSVFSSNTRRRYSNLKTQRFVALDFPGDSTRSARGFSTRSRVIRWRTEYFRRPSHRYTCRGRVRRRLCNFRIIDTFRPERDSFWSSRMRLNDENEIKKHFTFFYVSNRSFITINVRDWRFVCKALHRCVRCNGWLVGGLVKENDETKTPRGLPGGRRDEFFIEINSTTCTECLFFIIRVKQFIILLSFDIHEVLSNWKTH